MLVVGSVLMQSWQLGSVGCGCTEPVVWKTLGTTCERCQAGLEIPVDLPMWVSRIEEKKLKFIFENARSGIYVSETDSAKNTLETISRALLRPYLPTKVRLRYHCLSFQTLITIYSHCCASWDVISSWSNSESHEVTPSLIRSVTSHWLTRDIRYLIQMSEPHYPATKSE